MASSKDEKIKITASKSKDILNLVLAKEENKSCADCLGKGESISAR